MKFILASSSPRRARLLKSLKLEFTVVTPIADENIGKGVPPEQVVKENSEAKAGSVAAAVSDDAIVLGADTIVYIDGRILGKPRDIEEAREMLQTLSGKRHHVYTGLTLIDLRNDMSMTDFERTAVTFRRLSDRDIQLYLKVVTPLDRAGAYTVEGVGSLLVERFDGCFYNVVGLPLVKLDEMLRGLGVNLFHFPFQPPGME